MKAIEGMPPEGSIRSGITSRRETGSQAVVGPSKSSDLGWLFRRRMLS
jgi:hypothetical protein